MKKMLIIVGSLRKDSFNLQLAKEIQSVLSNRAEVTVLEYNDIPYMNEDIEYPAPESVARVRSQIHEADGLWIISPEYNYEIPGVLKNLLDWLSRPIIKRDWKTGSVVRGKPVTISGVAGKSGALGARTSLSELLKRMSMKVIGEAGTGFVLNANAFVTGKLEISETERNNLIHQADEFLKEIS